MSAAGPSAVARPPVESLAAEAHLWLLPLRGSIPAPLARRWRGLLSAEEAAANARFRVEAARREHLAARALVRTTLSRYAAVDPRDWRFRTGPEGRPEIAGPAAAPELRFNLSHTAGLLACLVTGGADGGVDVERPGRRLGDPLALARHGFAAAEREALARLGGGARRRLFCDLWTLKEAHVKARGSGFLALPASQLEFEITAAGLVRLRLGPELAGDRAEAWQTILLAPTADHRLAVAIRRGDGGDLDLVCREVEPESGEARRVRPEVIARSPSARAAVRVAD